MTGRSRECVHRIAEESPGSMDKLPGNAWAQFESFVSCI